MPGSKILATLSDIFSNADADEDYQGSVCSDRKSNRSTRPRERKKAPTSILGSHNSDIFSTINEEDYQAKHVAEMKRRDKARRKKPNKLMATMRDIFGSHDIDPDRVEREAQKRSSKRDIKRIDLSQYEDPESQLSKEREKVRRAEHQIQTLVAMNRDLQEQAAMLQEESTQDVNRSILNLKLRFNREEKSRLEAERREYMALKELEMLRSALATSRQRHHEAETQLTEAASDILDTRNLQNTCHDLQKSYEGAVKQERDSWMLSEHLKKEVETLGARLKHSEQEKARLRAEVSRLKAESHHWERALDTLQDQVDKVLGTGNLDAPTHKKAGLENGISDNHSAVSPLDKQDIYLSSSNSSKDNDANQWRSNHIPISPR